ncbi:MAG: GNAT family N-acetyltransferase [Chloroflexi bacterium]|nr:GNAT family N-acetyltransferase [Chloroflexota bacterium]
MSSEQVSVDIRLWSDGDLALLERLMGDPAMMVHLGGPETAEKIRDRHARYVQLRHSDKGQMFVIVVGSERTSAGSIGYWEKAWRDGYVWETGWSVLPEFQGQGIATRATIELIETVRAQGKHRFLHAYPSVDNVPSNALCKKLGFTLLEEADFEYPPGHLLRCNDWQFDLFPDGSET